MHLDRLWPSKGRALLAGLLGAAMALALLSALAAPSASPSSQLAPGVTGGGPDKATSPTSPINRQMGDYLEAAPGSQLTTQAPGDQPTGVQLAALLSLATLSSFLAFLVTRRLTQ